MALCLSVWIIECRSVFLSAFVVQSIQQQSPGELIRISRISLPANSDVTASFLPSPPPCPVEGCEDVAPLTAVCGRGSKVTPATVSIYEALSHMIIYVNAATWV